MKRNVTVNYFPKPNLDIEFVERKGLGHPDSLTDGIVELISRELCKYYLDHFGTILHHNVDKAQLIAGNVVRKKFIKPIRFVLGGRATDSFKGKKIPVKEIAENSVELYLSKIVPQLKSKDYIIDCYIAPGSADLNELFLRKSKVPLANDTSFGVGYAPYSELDALVLSVEKYLNSEYADRHSYIGSDIKVMGFRENNRIGLTLSVAFISKFVPSIDSYLKYKEKLASDVLRYAEKTIKKKIMVQINTADDPKNKSVYLTLSGTSAEMGDDGEVGRGNRVNGLITPGKPMSLEAAAGKNPVTHVGKLYNILAFETAKQISEELDTYAEIYLLSFIGTPINVPKAAYLKISRKNIEKKAQYILSKNIEDIQDLTSKLVSGKLSIF
ncbi:MAG: methionine adenosyltransferase [Candidatus Micrarchaeota archaeon]